MLFYVFLVFLWKIGFIMVYPLTSCSFFGRTEARRWNFQASAAATHSWPPGHGAFEHVSCYSQLHHKKASHLSHVPFMHIYAYLCIFMRLVVHLFDKLTAINTAATAYIAVLSWWVNDRLYICTKMWLDLRDYHRKIEFLIISPSIISIQHSFKGKI